jgi:NADH-quinone oxidoreductase subunit J
VLAFPELFFYLFATIAVLSAVGVVVSSNPVKATLLLVLTFAACAGIWLLLRAEFLAIMLILVYVGAVMVLFLFVVMMLDINLTSLKQRVSSYLPLGVMVMLVIFAELTWVFLSDTPTSVSSDKISSENVGNTLLLGELMFTEHLYSFELAALILLVAMILALVLTLGNFNQTPSKNLDVAKQVRVSSKDRLKIIKMESEDG